ncbi:hypothetical protein ACHAPU_008084 [Fusarium lateritium]
MSQSLPHPRLFPRIDTNWSIKRRRFERIEARKQRNITWLNDCVLRVAVEKNFEKKPRQGESPAQLRSTGQTVADVLRAPQSGRDKGLEPDDFSFDPYDNPASAPDSPTSTSITSPPTFSTPRSNAAQPSMAEPEIVTPGTKR